MLLLTPHRLYERERHCVGLTARQRRTYWFKAGHTHLESALGPAARRLLRLLARAALKDGHRGQTPYKPASTLVLVFSQYTAGAPPNGCESAEKCVRPLTSATVAW